MSSPSPLTPAQQVAHDQLLDFCQKKQSSLAVLEGFAGSGKTYLMGRLLNTLFAQFRDRECSPLRVAIAAPTNKAVRVLRDTLQAAGVPIAGAGDEDFVPGGRRAKPKPGCTCRSIHSFLGLKLNELENGKQETAKSSESSLDQYDVAIVDEASMIGADLFERIVQEHGACTILFVGDPAQLPPVKGLGALSPVFDRVAFKVRLTEVVRQAADNPIIRLSMALRKMIELGVKADPLSLAQALPKQGGGVPVALVAGTPGTLVDFWLEEHRADPSADTRIVAYTNAQVLDYNQRIHRALHGDTGDRVYVEGQRVIVHQQAKARMQVDDETWIDSRLITSEEVTVETLEVTPHPLYPHIPANRLEVVNWDDDTFEVYVPIHQQQFNATIDQMFGQWRALQAEMRLATGDRAVALKSAARDASGAAWALRNSFAQIRHSYALTCHKAQGSTFDCALVDFADLSRMPDPLEFNRALYVAVTRSRQFLALVC